MTATYALGRGFTLQRIVNAPPEMVFEAWTDPAELGWFFNPGHEPEHPVTVDLRVGGQWRQQMIESPDKKYFTGGVYREIVPGEKLVFNWGAVGGWPELDLADPDANPLVTVSFTPRGAQTVMDVDLQLPDQYSQETTTWWMNCGMVEGMGMTIDRLVTQFAPSKAARAG